MWNVRIARRKVRLFEQCRHPSVVPFIDVGTAGGMHYLAWPLIEGTSLEKAVATKGALSPDVASLYVSQAAEGLELCHQQKLIHGLLKPSNLMLGRDGQVYILDFGIGCLLAETEGESLVDTMSTANSVNSGLDCSSPESIMDPTNLTPIGDQYSLGCVLYFLLAARYPFPDGTAVEKMMAHQHKQPTSIKQLVPALSDGLAAVVEKLMEKAPADRFPSCAAVVEALRPFASAVSGPDSAAAGGDGGWRRAARRNAAARRRFGSAAAVGGGAAVVAYQSAVAAAVTVPGRKPAPSAAHPRWAIAARGRRTEARSPAHTGRDATARCWSAATTTGTGACRCATAGGPRRGF